MNSSVANPFRVSRLNHAQDYRVEWDVPSLNDKVSDSLEATVRSLVGRSQPDPGLEIPVLLAPPGYGKTHLFGRIAQRLNHEALFVFIPQIEDVRKPLEHIRWHTVESLFQEVPGRPSVINTVLARLCQESVLKYFGDLPPSLAVRHQQIQQQIEADSRAMLTMVSQVKEASAFLKLADSIARGFPALRGDVVKALALAWSPDTANVRRWLRGESLPEGDLLRLQLSPEPPDAGQVLLAATTLLGMTMPVVLCCDQLEAVLVDMDEGPIRYSTALVGLLQSVPNQLVIISCLEDRWPAFLDHVHGAFKRRVKTWKLPPLSTDQATEMVRRRLRTWNGQQADKGESWPIAESAIVALASQQVGPAGLIKTCADAFGRWADGEQHQWITNLTEDNGVADRQTLFLQLWNKELEDIKSNPARSPDELPEERLVRGVKESLDLTSKSQKGTNGICVEEIQEGELRWGTKKKSLLTARVSSAGAPLMTFIAVTKIDNGTEFRGYFNALYGAIDEPITGAVIVHPRTDLRMGDKTQEHFDEARREGKLRSFSLTEHLETFARMECLLTLLDKARAKELQLGQALVSESECRQLIIDANVLANLDILDSIGCGWRGACAENRREAVNVGASASIGGSQPGTRDDSMLAKSSPGPNGESDVPGLGEPADWANQSLRELVDKLKLWSLPVTGDGVEVGPTFARLRVRPQGKTSVNRIRNKAEDLKIHLSLEVSPIVGSHAGFISVDVQLPSRRIVTLDECSAEPPTAPQDAPVFPVGLDVAGKAHWLNLSDPADCHLLVAGTTGSGKSEFLKGMIAALCQRLGFDQLQFVLIDPKQVTFNLSGESPYLRHPVACNLDEALPLVQACFDETERRYALLKDKKLENVSQLQGKDVLPQIVVIIDEFADLMVDKEGKQLLDKPLKRIGALARAAGVHLVLATQRPEATVVTTLLRSNLPGRIGFNVASEADSKLILSVPDAFRLLGKGDLLWKHGGGLLRLQAPLVGREELEKALRL